ncbi:four helix bundle protein [Membranicola marinus]|uniref:Four helix bundle protein n=1 Tax=Membranihabitans marinus TaxID=1227546 RepID=A0A953HRL9_9BACT|nr:four helix bundle protein [Membranihabitans marinus]MBY5956628.1 four helix bundle protein [Membranihabitans marinus]
MDTFNFEKLIAWEKSVEFFDLIMIKTEDFHNNKSSYRLKEQLDAASASISMNIAEGTGRYSKKEYLKFLYYSRGSLYETVTLLILLNKRNNLSDENLQFLKAKAMEITKILNGLITSIRK